MKYYHLYPSGLRKSINIRVEYDSKHPLSYYLDFFVRPAFSGGQCPTEAKFIANKNISLADLKKLKAISSGRGSFKTILFSKEIKEKIEEVTKDFLEYIPMRVYAGNETDYSDDFFIVRFSEQQPILNIEIKTGEREMYYALNDIIPIRESYTHIDYINQDYGGGILMSEAFKALIDPLVKLDIAEQKYEIVTDDDAQRELFERNREKWFAEAAEYKSKLDKTTKDVSASDEETTSEEPSTDFVYPNVKGWSALKTGLITHNDDKFNLHQYHAQKLRLPSGQLIICDPLSSLERDGNPYIQLPSGDYDCIITLADVSEGLDGSHIRTAYASLILGDMSKESYRKMLDLTEDGSIKWENGGYGVDSATACFADAQTIATDTPEDIESWDDAFMDNGKDDCWVEQIYSKEPCEGVANVLLPQTSEDNNIILFTSGWGDGFYPIVASYSDNDELLAIHTDFLIVNSISDVE